MATEPSIFIWLTVLTLATVAQLVFMLLFWQRITHLPSIREIDLNDKMDRILHIATSDAAIRNENIRRHVRILLDSIEQDPNASERFYTQIQTLRRALQE